MAGHKGGPDAYWGSRSTERGYSLMGQVLSDLCTGIEQGSHSVAKDMQAAARKITGGFNAMTWPKMETHHDLCLSNGPFPTLGLWLQDLSQGVMPSFVGPEDGLLTLDRDPFFHNSTKLLQTLLREHHNFFRTYADHNPKKLKIWQGGLHMISTLCELAQPQRVTFNGAYLMERAIIEDISRSLMKASFG